MDPSDEARMGELLGASQGGSGGVSGFGLVVEAEGEDFFEAEGGSGKTPRYQKRVRDGLVWMDEDGNRTNSPR